MVRLLALGLVTGALVLAASARLRREMGELARDASDRLIMLLLRVTSGFASDVSEQVIAEERERRLRWRSADGSGGPNRSTEKTNTTDETVATAPREGRPEAPAAS